LRNGQAVCFATVGRRGRLCLLKLLVNVHQVLFSVKWKNKEYFFAEYMAFALRSQKLWWIVEAKVITIKKNGRKLMFRCTEESSRRSAGWNDECGAALRESYTLVTGNPPPSYCSRNSVGLYTEVVSAIALASDGGRILKTRPDLDSRLEVEVILHDSDKFQNFMAHQIIVNNPDLTMEEFDDLDEAFKESNSLNDYADHYRLYEDFDVDDLEPSHVPGPASNEPAPAIEVQERVEPAPAMAPPVGQITDPVEKMEGTTYIQSSASNQYAGAPREDMLADLIAVMNPE